jgi:hypothetical protein
VQRRQALVWEWSKLAACLLLGLTVGLIIRSDGSPAVGPNASAAVVRLVDANAAGSVGGGRNGFWSLANFAPEKSEPAGAGLRADSRYRLHWDSPVKMPHLEGNL